MALGRSTPDTLRNRALCVAHWNAGMTAGQIAALLGFSRNMVIGYVTRARAAGEHIVDKPKPVLPGVPRRRQKHSRLHEFMAAARSPPSPIPQLTSAPLPPLPFVELMLPSGEGLLWHAERGCRAILEGEVLVWCNAPCVGGEVYCAYHCDRFYTQRR